MHARDQKHQEAQRERERGVFKVQVGMILLLYTVHTISKFYGHLAYL